MKKRFVLLVCVIVISILGCDEPNATPNSSGTTTPTTTEDFEGSWTGSWAQNLYTDLTLTKTSYVKESYTLAGGLKIATSLEEGTLVYDGFNLTVTPTRRKVAQDTTPPSLGAWENIDPQTSETGTYSVNNTTLTLNGFQSFLLGAADTYTKN